MVLVLGTNSGFVLTAPTTDPAGVSSNFDSFAFVTKDTSPSRRYKIVRMGWYCGEATEESNFELGLYDDTGASNGAGTLLFSSSTNKGTSSGWKSIVFNNEIETDTDYWLGSQLDDTATLTTTDLQGAGGVGYDTKSGQTSLPNPFDGGSIANTSGLASIYALLEEVRPDGDIIEQNLTGSNSLNIFGTNWNATGFTIGTTGLNRKFDLTHIGLKLSKVGSPADLTVGIRLSSGGSPTGSDLSTGTILASQLTTASAGAMVYCEMTPYELQKNTLYHIVIRSPSSPDSSNMIQWKNASLNSYAGGFVNYSGTSGANWTQFTNLDAVFEVIGLEIAEIQDDDATISPLMLKPCLPL